MRGAKRLNAQQLGIVLLRVYALTLLVANISLLGSLTGWWIFQDSAPENVNAYFMYSSLAVAGVYSVVGSYLLLRARKVAAWMCGDDPTPDAAQPTFGVDLPVLSFGLMGLYFLVEGVKELIERVGMIELATGIPTNYTGLVGAAFKVGVGFWLFLGAPGVVRLVRWARGPGDWRSPSVKS